MSEITAILTRTSPLGTTLLLVGDDLLSSGSLVSSAEIDKSVFERLLTFAENYQEVRVVISYSDDSKVKIYDCVNTVFTDADGRKGLLLDKTGIVLYSGDKPTVTSDVTSKFNGETGRYWDFCHIDFASVYDSTQEKYKVYTKVTPYANCCFIGGWGKAVSADSLSFHILRYVGISDYHLRKGRKFHANRLYSKGNDGYDYETDGLLTKENAPNDKTDTNFYWTTFTSSVGGVSMPKTAGVLNFRPYIDVYESDGTTFVTRIYGGQITITIDENLDATAVVHNDTSNSQELTIDDVKLGIGARRYMYWVTGLGSQFIMDDYTDTNLPSNALPYVLVSPTALYNANVPTNCAIIGWYHMTNGRGNYSGWYIPVDLEERLAEVTE